MFTDKFSNDFIYDGGKEFFQVKKLINSRIFVHYISKEFQIKNKYYGK